MDDKYDDYPPSPTGSTGPIQPEETNSPNNQGSPRLVIGSRFKEFREKEERPLLDAFLEGMCKHHSRRKYQDRSIPNRIDMLRDILEWLDYTKEEIDDVVDHLSQAGDLNQQREDYLKMCKNPRRFIGDVLQVQKKRLLKKANVEDAFKSFQQIIKIPTNVLSFFTHELSNWVGADTSNLTSSEKKRIALENHDAILCIFCRLVFDKTFVIKPLLPPKPPVPEPPVSAKTLEVTIRITANGYKPSSATLKLCGGD